ncbi:fatty acid desaturase [Streptomyces sp. TRM 70351]|uniref:fatty acid desaturase family protein n=1 Tax=Streptomyces sp. TRM 70351 TaxID=3116552 RepID=UPI002E7C144B|nr:fatty acid desaturase [Streptomyces sp. TRM 70351]MEE1930436.1 fatty acid desaturase [Streptomyces sp. TRM 70351]
MSAPATHEGPQVLFRKARVTRHDEKVFLAKLVLAAALTAVAGYLALQPHPVTAVLGMLLLGAMYTHMVELQHQCLHHSAFRSPRAHRLAGVPLGLPLLVSYSHYRVRHLQHHRYLGTPQDSEFFGFDTRAPLRWKLLLRGLLDYPRVALVLKDVARSFSGRWSYDMGQIAERRRREIMAEYRLLGVLVASLAAVCLAGHPDLVLRLWLLPLLVAVPLHFLVELPEHILCETETTDVLRNTRSIRGSALSTWFTNGNNLHVEHHAAMVVPINRLRERHAEAEHFAVHVEHSYAAFFRTVAATARRNGKQAKARKEREDHR